MTATTRLGRGMGFVERHGALVAAIAAITAAAPGLRFPFLSDDWWILTAVDAGLPPATAYGYFRPLYMLTFWIDRHIWGASPAAFHLTNLLLLAACAALCVTLVRRLTDDARLAAVSGLLFALHPWHVENAAWIAVRGDPLFLALGFLASLSYLGWRRRAPLGNLEWRRRAPRALRPPILALVLLGLALLAKESAVIVPVALVALAWLEERAEGRSVEREEWAWGLGPMLGLAVFHLFFVRPVAMGGFGRSLTPGLGLGWAKHLYGYLVATIVPIDGEAIAERPLAAGLLAAGLWALLACGAVIGTWLAGKGLVGDARGSWRRLHIAGAAALMTCLLLAPSVIGYQERYLYVASAASAVALAALLLALPRPAGALAGLIALAFWVAGSGSLWSHWEDAARASRSLVSGLVAASREEGAREILVANIPFRVHGGSVGGDFRAALAVMGGRPMPVRALAWVSYPGPESDFLDGPPAASLHGGSTGSFVVLRVPRAPYCRFVPSTEPVGGTARSGDGRVIFEEGERMRIRMDTPPDSGRVAYAWVAGRLERLGPSRDP